MQQLLQVNEFMTVMGQEMPTAPCIPSPNTIALRHELIREENYELKHAAETNDIVEVADALCDSLYVVLGAFTAYGFKPELVEELFNEVQRSNMSKVCHSHEEAYDTMVSYQKQDIITHINDSLDNGLFTVVRASDNKVLKSINWSEPDLTSILIKHGVDLKPVAA
jgi:predicted HAD superfamily Cof-like phosphohydrolase